MAQQLAALVAAGQINPRTANLLQAATGASGSSERRLEAALRVIEKRIAGKLLYHYRELAGRIAEEQGGDDEVTHARD